MEPFPEYRAPRIRRADSDGSAHSGYRHHVTNSLSTIYDDSMETVRPRSLSVEMSVGQVSMMSRSESNVSMEDMDDNLSSSNGNGGSSSSNNGGGSNNQMAGNLGNHNVNAGEDVSGEFILKKKRKPTDTVHLESNVDLTDKISRKMSLSENMPTYSRISELREKNRLISDPEYELSPSLLKSVHDRVDPDLVPRTNFLPSEPSKLRSIPISDPIGIAGSPGSPRFSSPMRTRSRSPSPGSSPGSPRSPSFSQNYSSTTYRLKRRLSEDRFEPYHKRADLSSSPGVKFRTPPHNPFYPSNNGNNNNNMNLSNNSLSGIRPMSPSPTLPSRSSFSNSMSLSSPSLSSGNIQIGFTPSFSSINEIDVSHKDEDHVFLPPASIHPSSNHPSIRHSSIHSHSSSSISSISSISSSSSSSSMTATTPSSVAALSHPPSSIPNPTSHLPQPPTPFPLANLSNMPTPLNMTSLTHQNQNQFSQRHKMQF